MTRRRWLLAAWLAFGVVIWSAVFDWWMHGAMREYLRQAAEFEAGLGPRPDLTGLMVKAHGSGVVRASTWAATAVVAGWLTAYLMGRPFGRGDKG